MVVVVAAVPGGQRGAREVGLGGTFRRFGVDLVVGVRDGNGDGDDVGGEREPCVGLLIGRWLVDRGFSGVAPACEGWEIGEQTERGECERVGRAFAARDERVALLVMGDGSARRGVKSPGYLDERAIPFDDDVARALGAVDTAALAAIDSTTASELMAAGRAPWQVLAGAVGGSGLPWRGELLSYGAPYGVGYFTAVWRPEG